MRNVVVAKVIVTIYKGCDLHTDFCETCVLCAVDSQRGEWLFKSLVKDLSTSKVQLLEVKKESPRRSVKK